MTLNETEENRKYFDYIPILSGVIIFGLTFLLIYFLIMRGSDYNFHINEAQKISFANFYHSLKNLVVFTNPLWHILVALCNRVFKMNYFYAAAFVTASFNLATYLVIRVGINEYCINTKNADKNFMALMLVFVTAIYLPWFNQYLYLGQGSPTIWHNPTNIAVKGLALLIVFMMIKIWEDYLVCKLNNKDIILTGLLLLFSVLIKPSFMQIFFPGILMFCGVKILWTKEMSNNFILKILWILLPSFIILLFQFAFIFITNTIEQGRAIEISWFRFLKLYSPNILISYLISMAFPLYILVFKRKYILRENMLLLAICLYITGFLQGSFLYDPGLFGSAGDYMWGQQLAQFIIFVVTTNLFFNDLSSYEKNTAGNKDLYFGVGFSLLFLHFISGVYYYFFLLLFSKGQS